MSSLAQEEADRFFSYKESVNTHPEDRDNSSDRPSLDDDPSSADNYQQSDPGTDDDSDLKMATMTSTKTSYHIPTTVHYANTGPKGVIADAQNFARAKQTSFRQRVVSLAGTLTSRSFNNEKRRQQGSSSDSELASSEDENDSEFMNRWRANRIQELSDLSNQPNNTRRISPSRRVWGTLNEVDANGYLDAIEKVSDETVVVVMIFDPESTSSFDVEDELKTMAYKYSTTRFVKLHHEIAEMETVQIPAILAYKGGDVFATMSGVKAAGLEKSLKT